MSNEQAPMEHEAGAWARLSLPHRFLLAAYGVFALSMAAPWVRGEPFMNGFMGAPEKPARVIYGLEGAWPFALVAIVGLVALFAFDREHGRQVGQLATWVLLAGGAAFLEVYEGFICFLCENREVLWGVAVMQAASVLGLVLAVIAADWRRRADDVRDRLST